MSAQGHSIDCTDERLLDYLYDELSDGEREQYEEHVAGCARCAAELAAYRRVRQAARALPVEEFVLRTVPYLTAAGVLPEEPSEEQLEKFRAIAPLVQERVTVLSDAANLVRFLFVDEDAFAPEEAAEVDAAQVVDQRVGSVEEARAG